MGKGLRSSPRDALIDDACEASIRGRAFGFHRMMDTAGAVIGVVLAGFVLWLYEDNDNLLGVLRTVFAVAVSFCDVGWLLYALVYAGIALTTNNMMMLWVLFGLYGVYMALTEGVSKALIIDCVPPERKGVALSLLYMVLGFSTLSSNILAGYLWQTFGPSSPC